jgi:hypothetical protein
MKKTRRAFLISLLIGFFLFLGILSYAFLLDNIIFPLAIVLQLVWRILISANQTFYWGFLLIALFAYGFYRLALYEIPIREAASGSQNYKLDEIKNWRNAILFADESSYSSMSLKQDLETMVADVFAIDRPSAIPLDVITALRKRELPLPEPLYQFLYQEDGKENKRTFRKRLRALINTPKKLFRRWTGQEKAEYTKSLKEILTFMEEWMEIKNGDEYFNSFDH